MVLVFVVGFLGSYILEDTAATEIFTSLHTLALHDARPISRLGDVAEQRQPPDDRALRGDGRVLLAESLDQVNRAAVAVVAHLQGSFQRASIGPYPQRSLPLCGLWSPFAGTSRPDRLIYRRAFSGRPGTRPSLVHRGTITSPRTPHSRSRCQAQPP